MPTPSRPDRRPPASRAVRVLLGAFFLTVAGGTAWYALARPRSAPVRVVTVRALDVQGRPVPGAEVRTRYGGEWVRVDAGGLARLEAPRVREGQPDVAAALADALEARGTYHRLRRDRRARVARRDDGSYEAEFRLEHCGLLRLGVAMTAYASARATLDADPVRDRWRVVEGNDVVRAGQAATWAVFAGAPRLWVTLEGDRGVAQERVPIEPPGPGFLLERTLFPHPSRPIRGRLVAEGGPAATLEGVLEVTELPEGAEPVPRLPVRIEPDGTFQVDYTGEGRFQLVPSCAFVAVEDLLDERVAHGGDEDVRLPCRPRPWIVLATAEPLATPPSVSLARTSGSSRAPPVLPRDGAWWVAVPGGPGTYTLTVATHGSDAAAPRSGQAQVTVEGAGPTRVALALTDLPHGTVVVRPSTVPGRGATARVLPDRERTLLPRPDEAATFLNVPVGKAFVEVTWHEPGWARCFAAADVRAGETAVVGVSPEPGGSVRFDVSGTSAADAAEPWVLGLLFAATPYGLTAGNVPLRRTLVDGAPTLATEGALRAGRYRAELRSTRGDPPTPILVEFDVRPQAVSDVVVKGP